MHYSGVIKKIHPRPVHHRQIEFGDCHPVLKKIYQSREVHTADDLERTLDKLPSPWLLSGMEEMVGFLTNALENKKKILIVADYDADGATSCAVAVQGLKMLGAEKPVFVVPDRFKYGYGLTPEIVELASKYNPDILITVDNGISSIDGVKAAKQLGMTVLVTDHHLPGEELPEADAIVNPNLDGDRFPGGSLAGVGVIFYILLALRTRLREMKWFEQQQIEEPNLGQLLDYVALGIVADVVPLDHTNRILVHQGVQRIRSGKCHPGIRALIGIAGRNYRSITSADLGFTLGPRLNAAGRMDDMHMGIQCLLAEDEVVAKSIAQKLDDLNSERREVESQMKVEANKLLEEMKAFDEKHLPAGVCLYDKNWHQGVIGILASRVKDRLHRPVIAFAATEGGEMKGSARSIPGVHIRDVLSDIATFHPSILQKFGGHAMAAGMSMKISDYPVFSLAFDEMVKKRLNAVDLEMKIYSDGNLSESEITLDFAELLQNAGPWGQDYPEPVFDDVFDVIQARIVGQHHLKLVLRQPFSELLIDAIAFYVDGIEEWLGTRKIKAVYKLDVNEYKGTRSVQIILQYLEKLT